MCIHLQRRGKRYFFRRVISKDLQARYGKREITKALGTSDRRTALVLCRRFGLELDDAFRLARAQTPVQALEPVLKLIPASTRPLETKMPLAAIEAAVDATTLNDLADKWEAERQSDWLSVAATRRTVRRFTEMVGDILPCTLTRAHVVAFKDNLLASGQTGVNTNKQLTVFNTLLNYGVANGTLEHNPASGVKVTVKRNAKDARHPFPPRDLQTIFAALPPYTGEVVPKHIGHEAAYWVPLLALFYGARREELCQLRPEDIYEEIYADEAGTDRKAWVLRITDSGEGQKVKNTGSVRRVPIHEELIARGFLDFVARQQGQARLFSRLNTDKQGRQSAPFGKWFNTSLLSTNRTVRFRPAVFRRCRA